jgi:predicted protein tyrosine phosphatase
MTETASFAYRIDNAPAAYAIMQEGWPTHIVSLIGDVIPLRFDLPVMCDKHLIRKFDDTELVADQHVTPPCENDIAAVFHHTANLGPDDRLLIHCHAGQSRSTAMLIGILIQHGLTEDAAVQARRPSLIPNRLMIAMIDRALNLEGALNTFVADYYKRIIIPGIELPDRGGWDQ